MAAAGRVLPAKIEYDRDHLIGKIERGGVIWRGQDGRTRATVLEYAEDRRAPVGVDTIIEGTMVDHGTFYELTGVSERLINEVGVPKGQAGVSLKITPIRNCKGCR